GSPSKRSAGVRSVFIAGSGGLVDDGRLGRVLLHRLDPVERARLGLVRLADRDDLAVARLEAEPELARGIGVELELTRHGALLLLMINRYWGRAPSCHGVGRSCRGSVRCSGA